MNYNRAVRDVLHHYNKWIGFNLTLDQFTTLLKEDTYTKEEIISGGGYDTCVREGFMSFLSEKIIGQEWLDGTATTEQRQQFTELMKEKGRAQGYKIPDDWTVT